MKPGSIAITFIGAVALCLGLQLGVHAQQPAKALHIGYLGPGGPPPVVIDLLRPRLQALGYTEGKTLIFEERYARGDSQRLPELAAELVSAKVDVIIAITNAAAFAARDATRTIPIVVWASHGAADTALVASLARPGGNVTGLESLAPELDAKRLELLKLIVPRLTQVAALHNALDQGAPAHLKSAGAAARALEIALTPLAVRRPEDFEASFAAMSAKLPQALLTFTDPLTFNQWARVAEFATRNRLPTICEFKQMVQAGCLVSYGPTFAEFSERVAQQVEKVVKGARPADLPMEQPTRFELVINLKTARAIGLTIPQVVLLRADEVIE